MDGLRIEYLDIDELTPYERNAKKHPREQVEQIARSIQEFGMSDPIAIYGPNNTIVEGHGRLLACKELGLSPVPVIRLDYLTDEQRRAYTLIHNKLTLNSDFDLKLLNIELQDIKDIDMRNFDFDIEGIADDWDRQHQENKMEERFDDANILQLEKAQFPGVGPYDIPQLEPVTELPEIKEWIPFNYMLSEKHPEGKGVHFFINDYQFERIWSAPERYIEKLSKFAAVATPDFSPYGDMPFCLQLFNHYRKHWVGKYFQSEGLTVIPTIRASTDPRSMDWFLDGEPKGGAVIISSMWTTTDEEKEGFRQEYNTMFDTLQPNKVFLYGKELDDLRGEIVRIPTFSEMRLRNERR